MNPPLLTGQTREVFSFEKFHFKVILVRFSDVPEEIPNIIIEGETPVATPEPELESRKDRLRKKRRAHIQSA